MSLGGGEVDVYRGFRNWALLLVLAGPVPALAAFSNLYVFGDSLSDNGNLAGAFHVDLPPLWSHQSPDFNRVSNGPVAVERLAEHLGLPLTPSLHLSAGLPPIESPAGNDFAVATARARLQGDFFADLASVSTQVSTFLSSAPAGLDDALVVVFIGGNDVLDIHNETEDARASAVVDSATSAVGLGLDALIAAGARHLLVPNVFDIGLTPEGADDPALATRRTREYNDALARTVASVEQTRRVDILEYDLFTLGHTVFANPGAFGLANFTDPCTDGGTPTLPLVGPQPIGGCSVAVIDEYAFFDAIHPTAAMHAIIGDDLYAAIIPLPAALPLFVSTLAGFGWVVRRRGAGRPPSRQDH